MKLTAVKTRGWLGVAELSLSVTSRLVAITGPNGAGKTSLIEGIRFALLGTVPRGITRKTDWPMLVSEGYGKTGRVEVELDGERRYVRDIASGKAEGPLLPEGEAALLPYVLDAATFAGLDPAKRRSFLFGLAGIKVKPDDVGEKLAEEGVPADVVEQILPNLRGAFGAAADFAKERASEERGAWKATTGENYGSLKAADWRASVTGLEHALDAEALAALEKQLEGEREKLLAAQAAHAVAKSELAKSQRPATERKHRAPAEVELDLADAEGRLAEAQRELDAANLANANPGGITGPCPHCDTLLTLDRGAFVLNTRGAAARTPATEKRVADAKDAVRTLSARVMQLGQELAVAKAAAVLADAADPAVTAANVEFAAANVSAAQDRFARTSEQLTLAKAAANAEAQAAERTVRAAAAHQRVLGWLKAGELLAPEGIPARYVAKAVGPINDFAREAATITGWPQVTVGADMAVTINGTRPYELACESEQWRADAVLAAAIAKLSGLGLLVLDRFDVLEPDSRVALWDWLIKIAPAFDTVIAAGTLKNPPSFPPEDDVAVVWLGTAKE